jgi:aspartate dehydrogenase
MTTRVGLIGWGRIGARVAAHLGDGAEVVGVLVRPGREGGDRVSDLDAFLERRPEIVLECASPAALAAYGTVIVSRGIDLLPLSLCALIDDGLREGLAAAAARPGAGRVFIAPGAIGSLDLLASAREAGLDRVVYRTAKPLVVWRSNAAAGLVDLDQIRGPTTILRGSVREISRHFPHNLNLSVGIALVGLGLDRTEVELIADPGSSVTDHELEIWAKPGHAKLRIAGADLDPILDCADYTAYSLLRPLRTRAHSITL